MNSDKIEKAIAGEQHKMMLMASAASLVLQEANK